MGINTLSTHEQYMLEALTQARIAEELGEVPVGAVLVQNEKIIATGHNLQITSNDPSAHAEIITLRNAGNKLNNYRLIDTTLYVTLEPCVMCFGALIHARVNKIVFATNDEKTGSCGGCLDLSASNCFNHHIEIVGGILQQEAQQLLQQFFQKKRQQLRVKK